MNTLKRALGNSSAMMISQLITWTATIVLTSALGRYLGAVGLGHLYLAMTFGVIFSILVEFGLDQQLVRAVARDRSLAWSHLTNSIAIKLILSVVAYGSILVIVHFLHYLPKLELAIAIYAIILPFTGISGSVTATYQACESMPYSVIGTVVEKLFVSIAGIQLLTHGYGIIALAAVYVIGAIASAGVKAYFLSRIISIGSITVDLQAMRALFIGAIPFFVYWALGAVYYRVDAVLLSKLTSAEVVGWYAAAYKLFDTLVFLPGIISTAIMLPILARLSMESRADLRIAMSKGLEIMLILGIPVCTGLFILAGPIIRFLYGRQEFMPAASALRLLAVALLVLYVNSMLSIVLVSLNREKNMTLVAALATIFNVVLNWLLIPHFQHIAAAAVTAGTELFILCYLLVVIPKDLFSRSSMAILLKAGASAAVMAAALYGLRGQSLLLLIPVGGLVYVISGLLLRIVPSEDLRLLKRAIAAHRSSQQIEAEATKV